MGAGWRFSTVNARCFASNTRKTPCRDERMPIPVMPDDRCGFLICFLLCLGLLCRAQLIADAGNWPQFQGATRNGLAAESGLARGWPQAGAPALWTAALAESYGGAAVRDGQVFIMDRRGEGTQGRDTLHCLQLADGKELWHFSYAAPGEFDLNGARGTPAIDAECVYAIGPLGHVYCIDRTTHTPRWHANLLRDFHGACPRWGVAQSPLLYRDLLIMAPQSTTAGVVALDKHTGKTRWKSEPLGLMSYASPVLTVIDGHVQLVMLTSGKSYHANTIIAGIDPATGHVLWRYSGWQCLIPIPCPTPLGDGRFFLTGGDSKSVIFQVLHEGAQWKCRTVTANIPCASALQNALCYQGYLYVNSASDGSGLLCLDLHGHVVWKHNTTPSLEQGGNLIIADGMLYFTHGKNGMLYLAEASPACYRELAAMKALEPNNNWTPMALAEGKLLVRDKKYLHCFDVRAR